MLVLSAMRAKKPYHKRKPPRKSIKLSHGSTGAEAADARRAWLASTASRKSLQLCKQIERSLGLILGEFDNPVLSDLQVVGVEPVPHCNRLLITLRQVDGTSSTRDLLSHLASASGRVRCEIAASIHRKRAPELSFCVVPSTSLE